NRRKLNTPFGGTFECLGVRRLGHFLAYPNWWTNVRIAEFFDYCFHLFLLYLGLVLLEEPVRTRGGKSLRRDIGFRENLEFQLTRVGGTEMYAIGSEI